MSYSNLTNFNRNFIKKFTHNSRFNIAIKILKKNFSSISINVLDYGAGDGEFLKKINKEIPGLKDISAYEPLIGRYDEVKLNISSYKNMNVYHKYDEIGKRYEVIFCMEVFEHLNKKLTVDALNNISNLLTKNGLCIVSVPIETGIGGFLKNIIRVIIGQTHSGLTFKNIFKILLGLKIERNEETDFISSHIGFSYYDLENLIIKKDFNILQKSFSPFSYLGASFNSQIFFVIQKKLNT